MALGSQGVDQEREKEKEKEKAAESMKRLSCLLLTSQCTKTENVMTFLRFRELASGDDLDFLQFRVT